MDTRTAPEPRLPLLDGLRGLAAIFVMMFHVELTFGVSGPFSRSYLFVDFFFLLSGFVLTLAAEARMNAGLGAIGFMRSRLRRLWPVIAIGVLIGAARHLGLHEAPALAFATLMGLLMIPMLHHAGMIYPLNGPHWSLLQELIANLVHGLILRRLSDSALLAVAGIAAMALVATVLHFGANTAGPFSHNWWGALPRVAFAYTLGIWMGRKWMAGGRHHRAPWPLALLLPGAALLALPTLPLDVALGDLAMVLLLFPPLLWLGAASRIPKAAAPWLARLGAISFPLYAIHLPMIEMMTRFGQSVTIQLLVPILLILVAAAIAPLTAPGKLAIRAAR